MGGGALGGPARDCKAFQGRLPADAVVPGQRQGAGLPAVRAHRRQYGRRGNLQQYLADALRIGTPAQLNTAQLAQNALVRFELAMCCSGELYDFKVNTVGLALRRLQALGLIERLTAT
jgi:hypothetical protein